MAPITGFITGTGLYSLPGAIDVRSEEVATPYGRVAVELASMEGQPVVFIPRHGKRHTIAPRGINVRGNVWAMKELGVERILATSVSGSLVPAWGPGTLVLIDQFLNFSSGRPDSFYPLEGRLVHIDASEPYCATLHGQLAAAAGELGARLERGATYACMDGPRFETRAEIEMLRRLGVHLVGHTNFPECVLARELAICYATLGVVSNFAAGMQATLTATEVRDAIARFGDVVGALFAALLRDHPEHPDCSCRHALDHAEL